MIEVYRFDDERVRVVMRGDEPWFVGADVCRALGLANGRDAIARLDSDGVGDADVIDSMGRSQRARIISEPGLYQLIFQSRVEGAHRFRRWVTHEVLPSIRKTGGYGERDALAALSDPSTLRQLLGSYAERVIALEAENEAARPKVEVYDRLIESGDTVGFREGAKLVRAATGANESEFRAFLLRRRWIQRLGGKLAPAHYGQSQEYVTVREREFVAHDGSRKITPELRITQRGIARAIEVLLTEEAADVG